MNPVVHHLHVKGIYKANFGLDYSRYTPIYTCTTRLGFCVLTGDGFLTENALQLSRKPSGGETVLSCPNSWMPIVLGTVAGRLLTRYKSTF